jgi:hypothetical protein
MDGGLRDFIVAAAPLPQKTFMQSSSGRIDKGFSGMFRAIIRLFCDLQNARHLLFRQLAQVINPLNFSFECRRNNKETP